MERRVQRRSVAPVALLDERVAVHRPLIGQVCARSRTVKSTRRGPEEISEGSSVRPRSFHAEFHNGPRAGVLANLWQSPAEGSKAIPRPTATSCAAQYQLQSGAGNEVGRCARETSGRWKMIARTPGSASLTTAASIREASQSESTSSSGVGRSRARGRFPRRGIDPASRGKEECGREDTIDGMVGRREARPFDGAGRHGPVAACRRQPCRSHKPGEHIEIGDCEALLTFGQPALAHSYVSALCPK